MNEVLLTFLLQRANYIWAWEMVTDFSTFLYMCFCTGTSETPFFILIVWEHQMARVKHSEICVAWWCVIFCPLAVNYYSLVSCSDLWYCFKWYVNEWMKWSDTHHQMTRIIYGLWKKAKWYQLFYLQHYSAVQCTVS